MNKTYVSSKTDTVIVVGGANIDIKGSPKHSLNKNTSNPGSVSFSLGGVANNIAHNLAKLNIPVSLISIVGEDVWGKEIMQKARQAGINTEQIIESNKLSTGTYLALLDEDNDMDTAIADMDILENLSPETVINSLENCKETASIVVFDTNIPEETLRSSIKYCHEHNMIVAVEPVSMKKSEKLLSILSLIDILTPNIYELEVLSQERISNHQNILESTTSLDISTVAVTLGGEGAFIYDHANNLNEFISPHIRNNEIQDTTGAGDAFMAGLVYGLHRNLPIKKAAQYGLQTAEFTITSKESVHPDLSEEIFEL